MVGRVLALRACRWLRRSRTGTTRANGECCCAHMHCGSTLLRMLTPPPPMTQAPNAHSGAAGSMLVVPAGLHKQDADSPASNASYVYARGDW